MSRLAIFPGSFDPFTRGHAHLVEQALSIFDSVVIAIGENQQKRGLLSVEERKRLIEDTYALESRISVEIYEGLTADYAISKGAVAMIRGVRSISDFEYERGLSAVNKRICPDVVTVMLYATADIADVSSSVVRELYSYGREVDEFMPEGIKISNYIK